MDMKYDIPGGSGRGRGLRWLVVVAFWGMACSSGTTDPEPGPTPVQISYSPQSTTVPLLAGDSREFIVTVTGTDIVDVEWSLDDAVVGTGTTHLFEAASVGAFDLSVAVDADGTTGDRSWELVVSPDESTLPPVVANLTVDHGPAPGEVVVRWSRVSGTHPLEIYLVAVSYTDRITEAVWDEADFVAEVLPQPVITQELVMSSPAYDIRPGERAWVAVRARDDHGQISHLDASVSVVVTTAWYLDLVIRDDRGDPLGTTLFSYDCGECVEGIRNGVTGADGSKRLGPFRSVDAVTVVTNSSDDEGGVEPTGWYDYTTEPLTVGVPPLEIVLPGRYELDLEPCIDTGFENFMDYLQYMTKTAGENPADPERRLLHRWSNYPVTVYIRPETLPQLGEDTAPHLRLALGAWETALGAGWLVETPDENGADIIMELGDLDFGIAGLTVVEPGPSPIGSVVPERVRILIATEIPFPNMVSISEVGMHEMGHALGLLNHSCLSGKGNLMDSGGLAMADLEAIDASLWHTLIHATETRAVGAIRHLPPGVVMTGYETGSALR